MSQANFLFLSITFLLTYGLCQAKCPSRDWVRPCSCNDKLDRITCARIDDEQLRQAFERLSVNIPQKQDKHFKELVIDDYKSVSFPDRFTLDLTFESIEIDNLMDNIKYNHFISKEAFNKTADKVKRFVVRTTMVGPDKNTTTTDDVFKLIGTFSNLEYLELESPNIDTIPKSAFKSLQKLRSIKFGPTRKLYKSIRRIEDDAFENLKRLERLNLRGNEIEFLSSNSLRMDKSNVTIRVDLAANNFNYTSFADGSLEQFNRPVRLDLSHNKIVILQEDVFKSFLDADQRNSIVVYFNPLACESHTRLVCRHKWLKVDEAAYKTRVKDAYCNVKIRGPTIFDATYEHC